MKHTAIWQPVSIGMWLLKCRTHLGRSGCTGPLASRANQWRCRLGLRPGVPFAEGLRGKLEKLGETSGKKSDAGPLIQDGTRGGGGGGEGNFRKISRAVRKEEGTAGEVPGLCSHRSRAPPLNRRPQRSLFKLVSDPRGEPATTATIQRTAASYATPAASS